MIKPSQLSRNQNIKWRRKTGPGITVGTVYDIFDDHVIATYWAGPPNIRLTKNMKVTLDRIVWAEGSFC